jgi:hypothetical protein
MAVKLKLIGYENEWGYQDWKIVTMNGVIIRLNEAEKAGLIKLKQVWIYKPFEWKYIVELHHPDKVSGFIIVESEVNGTVKEEFIPLPQVINKWGE